jgi:oligogalacturonide lyase
VTGIGVRSEAPAVWTEPETGCRVTRLSGEPGSRSLYFHQNAFTAEGDRMVFSTTNGLSVLDLDTGGTRNLIAHRVGNVVVGRRNRRAFYIAGDILGSVDVDTGEAAVVARVPLEFGCGSRLTLNSDETLLAGTSIEPGQAPVVEPGRRPDVTGWRKAALAGLAREGVVPRRWFLTEEFDLRLPRLIYTIAVSTGKCRIVRRGFDWYNHVQFSPTDPSLLLYCHEGPWHKVDRIWTVQTDGAGARCVHRRTMDMEIAGHEFWAPDGSAIWYDLQTPKGEVFWLAATVLATGESIRYPLPRAAWSTHFNVAPEGRRFAGDGAGPRSVAAPVHGQWIYLLTPEDGRVRIKRLVDLRAHDYALEPHVRFTPDGRRVIFRSNIHGAPHIYAVDIA